MKANDVQTVAVIGAGTMGAGIAGEFARAGCAVRLADTGDDILMRGMGTARAALDALVEEKLATRRDAEAALKRIETTTDLAAACRGVQLLVEAVPEDLALKQRMFAEFDALCPQGAILASNTSGLSVTMIAEATKRPDLVAGTHFWNPPHVVPLVEIVKGEMTSEATLGTLSDLCLRMGKRPVIVRKDVPGFVGNRLQFAVLREALHILSEGIATAEDIDAVMTSGLGLRWGAVGPLRTADLGGLDVFCAISQYLFGELASGAHPPPALTERVEKGELGAKSGGGFYNYPPEEKERILRERDRLLLRILKLHRS